ncbi:hypothetical protein [Microbacterium oleivorans]|uniref:hypothetical protein n=1 Tax=Microbacterium oleivorans TaxID=273677 RepID=UPI00080E7309|nr:hypothetical protein [Microbacterium oleivorans]
MKDAGEMSRFRHFFADTWWRIAWFVGAVLWCAAVNALLMTTQADQTWWGPVSVIPILAFAADALRRDYLLRRTHPQ